MKCSQCGTQFEGKFCPKCGAPAVAETSTSSEQTVVNQKKAKVKKPFYKKWWFWVIVAVIIIAAIGNSGDETDKSSDTSIDTSLSSQQSEESKENDIVINSINNFTTKEYSLETGNSVELSTMINPRGITKEDIVINSSDSAIVSITDVTVEDSGIYTKIIFKCNAVAEGTSIVNVTSADGKIESNDVTFTIEQAPKIKTIGKFSSSYAAGEIGSTRNVTVYMTPAGITKDDFTITNTDSSVVEVSDIQVNDDGDKTVLTFTTLAVKAGSTKIAVVSVDGKTESNTISFTVNEKDTSSTVYVTPYGEKYHFSSACAGKNATATTLNKAKASGKGACEKCAR